MKRISVLLTAVFLITTLLSLGSFAGSTEISEAAGGRTLLADNVKQDTIVGTVDGFSGESPDNMFDSDTTTKFCTNEMPCEVTWSMDGAYVVDAFLIATANDNADYNGRNPSPFTLYGSTTDGDGYVALYTGSEDDLAEENYTYFLVQFSNTAAYTYYKLEIDGTVSGTLQISEFVLVKAAASGYPSSGYTPASGSIINGTVIGNETGWDGTEACGAAAAFDGDADTFFDPLGVGDGFCGMDAGDTYILTAVNILPRSGQLPRYLGAMIQGSNDGTTWTTLFTSEEEATDQVWYTTTEFDNNTGYRYYRYFNETNHGDVADVEFYGVNANAPAETEAPAAEPANVVETPVTTAAAQTADVFVLAIIALTGSAIVIKKAKR